MRATQTTTFRSLGSFLDRTSESMAKLQLQAATGKRLNRPSDDPTAISPVLSARTQIQQSDRYIETIDSGLDRINNMDGNFAHIENIMQRVREIAIAGVNGALSVEDMATYGDEVGQLKGELLSAANAQVDGKYLFGGYQTKTTPFELNPAYDASLPYDPVTNAPVLYNGDSGQMKMEIGPDEQVRVGIDGGGFFLGKTDTDGDGVYDTATGSDLFQQLTQLEEALQANDVTAVSGSLTTIDQAMEQTSKQRSLLGNIGSRLETARGHMEDIKIDMETMRSRYEDADIISTITSLQQQQQSFEAALNVTGQVSTLSILDYLR